MPNKGTTNLWNKEYIILLLVNLISAIGFNMVYTMIVDYSVNFLGGTLVMGGIIAGIFSITALCVRPFAGIMADNFNKKYICIWAIMLIIAASLGYAFSPNVGILLLFRVMHGIGFSINSTTNIALVSLCIPENRIGEGIGYLGVGQVFSQIVGPGLGELLKQAFGYKILFVSVALLSLCALILLIKLFPNKTENQKTEEKNNKKSGFTINSMIAQEVLFYALLGGVFSFGNGIVSSFLKVMCNERNIENYTAFFSINALVLFLIRMIIGKIVDKKGFTIVITGSFVIAAISMILLAYASSLNMIILAAILKAIGQGGGQVALQAESIKKVDESKRGVAASTFYIGADIGQGIGPWIGGFLSDTFNYKTTFSFTALLTLFCGIIFFINQMIARKNNILKNGNRFNIETN
ncbi:putative MFS family arabinose efflux permease [Caldicoprobacter guelmensis]|uniref:MFS transporter n=1 Tax=Caldicoprobacter guelmensis TaxID=1170224 RepID=UPI00195ADA90|nr:MFS transporter [Caldicoprobacter guelmensis]MBM7583452.1 putative MFS family arabinose efflux permease [Caldicoprobacter guelmensis]